MADNAAQFTADLKAGCTGFTFMPKFWTLSHNRVAPVLQLHDDHLEYRSGFRTKQTSYDMVKSVDVFSALGAISLCLSFSHSPRTFYGSFRDASQRAACLKLFQEKSCAFTEQAIAEIDQSCAKPVATL